MIETVVTLREHIESLEQLRRKLCAYGGHGTCDCKFHFAGRLNNSEVTGCPELRVAIDALQATIPAVEAAAR